MKSDAGKHDQVYMVAPVHQGCQTCTFSSVIPPLLQSAYKLGNTEVSIPRHKVKQDGGDQVFLTFLTVYRPVKIDGNPRRRTSEMAIVTVCTSCFWQRYQCFMKAEFTMNSNENSSMSSFHLFHTTGAVYPTLVAVKGNRRFTFVDFGHFACKIYTQIYIQKMNLI